MPPGRTGHPGLGEGLALEMEMMRMWFLPLTITLEMKKTRSGWQASLRVTFIF